MWILSKILVGAKSAFGDLMAFADLGLFTKEKDSRSALLWLMTLQDAAQQFSVER